MKVNVADSGKELLITIAGSIDSLTSKDLRASVESYPFDKADSIIIDLADVPYVSSAGLREFLIMQKRFKKGKLIIRNVSTAVRDIFDVTGFSDMFTLEQKFGKPDDYTIYSFKDFLASKKENSPDRVILDDGVSHWSWKDLDRASELIAEDLIRLGAKKGSHIALCGSNSLNWIAVFFAIQKIGAMAVLVSPLLKASEICFLSQIGDITIFCHGTGSWLLGDSGAFFEEITNSEKSQIRFLYNMMTPIDIADREPDEMMSNVISSITVQKDDPCVMIFTSGSTGVPKGVLLSSFNVLTASTCGMDLLMTDENDVYCLALPLFHIFGILAGLMVPMLNDSKIVIPPRIKPDDILHIVEKEGCTILNTVPTVLLGIAALPAFNSDKVHTLTRSVIAGAAISKSQLLLLMKLFVNTTFDIAYGLSEISIVSYTENDDSIERKTTTVGKPKSLVRVMIQNPETGEECMAGDIGEIIVQGEFLMSGYYKTPLEKQDFDEKGWFHTGDLGFLDEDGYLHFVGRKKEIIIRGGENIIPGEIAEAATSFPGVAACQIVGIPDAYWGEVVGCALMTSPDQSFDVNAFNQYLVSKLAKYKLPEHVFVYESFPMLPNGKVDMVNLKKDMIRRWGND
ncbi:MULTISPECIES: AMP-binding protein [unclassified Butyrivibrio]|uniref:AMP-binding protein n=1 Tax=unclassified Butyrivibrio TaxID=2639466 RepID=UPI0004263F38|nr:MULTISPECIES: AMP-binding protein [unclassified Butyrivibrio]